LSRCLKARELVFTGSTFLADIGATISECKALRIAPTPIRRLLPASVYAAVYALIITVKAAGITDIPTTIPELTTGHIAPTLF
jgi:hypothetical protein